MFNATGYYKSFSRQRVMIIWTIPLTRRSKRQRAAGASPISYFENESQDNIVDFVNSK